MHTVLTWNAPIFDKIDVFHICLVMDGMICERVLHMFSCLCFCFCFASGFRRNLGDYKKIHTMMGIFLTLFLKLIYLGKYGWNKTYIAIKQEVLTPDVWHVWFWGWSPSQEMSHDMSLRVNTCQHQGSRAKNFLFYSYICFISPIFT